MERNIRLRRSLDKDWSFCFGDLQVQAGKTHEDIYSIAKAGAKIGPPSSQFDARDWRILDLPHDWSVEQPFDPEGVASWGYKPKGIAWYRKCFALDSCYEGKQILLEFDGIATQSTIYLNGSIVKRNYSAYNGFVVDITDRVMLGGASNVLAVHVDATMWEGWWYEGAGIYRHSWLMIKEPMNIAQDGVWVNPMKLKEDCWNTQVEVELNNTLYEDKKVHTEVVIYGANDARVARAELNSQCKAYQKTKLLLSMKVKAPKLWKITSPNLYYAVTTIYDAITNEELDAQKTTFGYREIRVDADKGFFLNGKNIKLLGTCNHQDHAGIGVAVPDSLWEYRVRRLKEMGSNAYRCAHGMPSKELLDECDRQGMLVMDENRNFETSDTCLEELRSMVKRDRNHPSVIMYSIFNEEPLQGTLQGKKMALRMQYEIKRLDPTRFVTGAMNGGILEDTGVGQVLDVVGVNYQPHTYDDYHKKYPKNPMIASETTSSFQVRGCCETNQEEHTFSGYDEDCANWGSTIRQTWEDIFARDFVMGAFMWTGFDYLGEPTPHVYPSVSSFFGMMDTCGFAKGGYYLCQALWSNKPYCHVLPHWNFTIGQIVTVMSLTNCEEAEIFVNGISHGRKAVERMHQVRWEVRFVPGTLELIGYNQGVKVASHRVDTSKEMEKIEIKPYRSFMYNDGFDVIPFDITAYDENEKFVPTCQEKVSIEVIEGGRLLGTGNGNPNCHEDFKSEVRSLFQGKCQAIIAANEKAKQIRVKVTVRAKGDKPQIVSVCTLPLQEKKES